MFKAMWNEVIQVDMNSLDGMGEIAYMILGNY